MGNQAKTVSLYDVTRINSLTAIGLVLVFLFFGVFGGWAVTMPLGGAVITVGKVIKEGNTKEISHELGGVLGNIRVREGDHVNVGDVLVVLDDIDRRSKRDNLRTQLQARIILQARLNAEQNNFEDFSLKDVETQISLPKDTDFTSSEFLTAFADQRGQFLTRKAKHENDIDILKIEHNALKKELLGIQNQSRALEGRIASLSKEVSVKTQMTNKGYGRASELRQFERELSLAKEERARVQTQEATLPLKISAVSKRIKNTEDAFAESLSQEIAENRRTIVDIKNQLDAAENAVKRIELLSPVSGIIDKVHMNTIGSAVAAFTPIVEIVPDNAAIVIEVEVKPTDIDLIKVGQKARVVMSAFNRNKVLPLDAKTIFVSPDQRTNKNTGVSFFTARLEVEKENLEDLPPITPGMPVEAYLKTEERTFAEIILGPFLDSLDRSFRG